MGLYSMMSAFLLSLNFNIWQFATKHICYSNIYTTYIAIYVTSQQRMVSKWKKTKQTTTKQKKRNKKKKDPYSMVRGAEKIITKFGTENLYTNLQSERCDCAIKKKGFRHFSNYWRHGTHCLCFKFSFLLFVKWLIDAFLEMKLCILLFMRST